MLKNSISPGLLILQMLQFLHLLCSAHWTVQYISASPVLGSPELDSSCAESREGSSPQACWQCFSYSSPAAWWPSLPQCSPHDILLPTITCDRAAGPGLSRPGAKMPAESVAWSHACCGTVTVALSVLCTEGSRWCCPTLPAENRSGCPGSCILGIFAPDSDDGREMPALQPGASQEGGCRNCWDFCLFSALQDAFWEIGSWAAVLIHNAGLWAWLYLTPFYTTLCPSAQQTLPWENCPVKGRNRLPGAGCLKWKTISNLGRFVYKTEAFSVTSMY